MLFNVRKEISVFIFFFSFTFNVSMSSESFKLLLFIFFMFNVLRKIPTIKHANSRENNTKKKELETK